ncbi:MAG TPA: phenylalanine--tRNA ligase subunit beta [Fimbriimonas sp.]|nr:phenylalanine--tRNA ligase subunit beta [Fimbriimonas sp.]
MKFPYSMLLDFVQTDLTAEEAGDLLTMAGFELEGIEEVEGEKVLDIKVMSNRGDGLSILGLAREVLAKEQDSVPTELYLNAASRFADRPAPTTPNPATATIETPDCNRFACRVFEGVTNGPSPDWIQTRLRKAGQRPISLFVDLTNYVMMELGQPLHAFDYDKLRGGRIVVRKPRPGETLTTLDGKEHELQPDQMMICDAERPVSVAGVMGGEETEVTAGTTRVLLESASFLNTSIRRTRKQLGLNTEASYRFERSVDPDGVVAAIERFSDLLGQAGSEIFDVYPGKVERQPVAVKMDRARVLLGMYIEDKQAQGYLVRLGMEVMGHGDPFYVVPPSWRPDIVAQEDLVEELGRVHGYEEIPELLPAGTTTLGGQRGQMEEVDRLREAAIRAGYIQIVSHSLRDLHPLDAPGERVEPRNPASPEMAYLRNSLLPSLADAARRNGGRDLHLFEIGKVFSRSSSGFGESRSIGFMSTGELIPSDRKGEAVPNATFFSLKGDLEAISHAVGRLLEASAPLEGDNRLHPSRQAQLVHQGAAVGVLGQIHPSVSEELRLPRETIVAELDVDALLSDSESQLALRPISRNPSIRRDIALLIDKAVPYREIDQAVIQSGGEILERHWLFDVFEGQGIPDGKHSLGIALQLRKFGDNLTDEEANQVRAKVVAALAQLGGATR